MKKSLLFWPLAFLFAWPSLASASDGPKAGPASFYCAAAGPVAVGYVEMIKEQYDGRPKDRLYFEAQLKYRIAAAKFAGLRATLELEAIGGRRMPNVNEARYQPMVTEALRAFDEFCAVAQCIVFPLGTKADDGPALAALDLSSVIRDIFSFISGFQDLWVRHDAIREARLKKFDAWINTHYNWPDWRDIGNTAAIADSP